MPSRSVANPGWRFYDFRRVAPREGPIELNDRKAGEWRDVGD